MPGVEQKIMLDNVRVHLYYAEFPSAELADNALIMHVYNVAAVFNECNVWSMKIGNKNGHTYQCNDGRALLFQCETIYVMVSCDDNKTGKSIAVSELVAKKIVQKIKQGGGVVMPYKNLPPVVSELINNNQNFIFIPCSPMFMHNVVKFVFSIDNNSSNCLAFNSQSTSYMAWTLKNNGVNEVINYAELPFFQGFKTIDVSLFFSENKNAVKKLYNDTIFQNYTGVIPSTNNTYQSHFTVLSRDDCGVETKDAFIDLVSENMLVQIRASSLYENVSQDIIYLISIFDLFHEILLTQEH